MVTETSSWPDIDPEAFEVYRSWLYLRDIPRYITDNEVPARSLRLIKAHRLADELDDKDFCYAVRNAIVDHSTEHGLSAKAIAVAYKLTDGACPLRGFLCSLYHCIGDSGSLTEKSMPQAFLVDLASFRMEVSEALSDVADVRLRLVTAGQLPPSQPSHWIRESFKSGWRLVLFTDKALKHPVTKFAMEYLPGLTGHFTKSSRPSSKVLYIGA
jgi:hypothetical protein